MTPHQGCFFNPDLSLRRFLLSDYDETNQTTVSLEPVRIRHCDAIVTLSDGNICFTVILEPPSGLACDGNDTNDTIFSIILGGVLFLEDGTSGLSHIQGHLAYKTLRAEQNNAL